MPNPVAVSARAKEGVKVSCILGRLDLTPEQSLRLTDASKPALLLLVAVDPFDEYSTGLRQDQSVVEISELAPKRGLVAKLPK